MDQKLYKTSLSKPILIILIYILSKPKHCIIPITPTLSILRQNIKMCPWYFTGKNGLLIENGLFRAIQIFVF